MDGQNRIISVDLTNGSIPPKIVKVALQSMSFILIAIFLARIVARYGALPIAAQKIDVQVEGISYMTASGFSTALCAFKGQNFEALKWNKIVKGYSESLVLMTGIGLISFAILFFFPSQIISFIVFTGLRIPFLSQTILGLEGVWWSISASSVFKGVVLMSWFIYLILKQHEIQKRDLIPSLIYRWNAKYFKDKLQI